MTLGMKALLLSQILCCISDPQLKKAWTAGPDLVRQISGPISHHEEETHPWAWGLTFLLTCPMFSSAYVAYSSTWNKNSLLPPSQPLAPLLFWAKISNSRVDGWARSRSKSGRSTEHSHGLVLQLFYFCFWWLVLTYNWGIGTHCPTPPLSMLPLSLLSPIASHSLQHGHTAACQGQRRSLWPIWCPPCAFSPPFKSNWICVCSGATELSQGDWGALHSSRTGSEWPASPSSPLGPATDWRSLEGMDHPEATLEAGVCSRLCSEKRSKNS